MAWASMEVSADLLRSLLCLPEETRFVGAHALPFRGTIEFVVDHPDLKEPADGQALPVANPTLARRNAGPREIVFCGWGQD
jgi:hypothetical protein